MSVDIDRRRLERLRELEREVAHLRAYRTKLEQLLALTCPDLALLGALERAVDVAAEPAPTIDRDRLKRLLRGPA